MRVIKFIQALMLALYWQLPIGKQTDLQVHTEIVRDLTKKKKNEKRRRQKTKEPFRWRDKQLKVHRNYKSTKPKDVRFSDQRKLRKLYRND